MKSDGLCFVQFIHPGGEHVPDGEGRKAWNRGAHRRKFLRNPGRCMRGDVADAGDLHFWGEWEPESEILTEIRDPLPFGPRFVHRPFYVPKRECAGLQNTDPFVYGTFHYTGCQQYRGNHATRLRHLDRGSVILFGSRVGGEFVLDTVFVVASWLDHHAGNWRAAVRGAVSAEYAEVTLEPWYARSGEPGAACGREGAARSYRLYQGATYADPVEGMFSYVPCTPAADTPVGFPRPRVRLTGVVTPSLSQGLRLNSQTDVGSCARLWHSVREQVEAQSLELGVHAGIPERRTGRP